MATLFRANIRVVCVVVVRVGDGVGSKQIGGGGDIQINGQINNKMSGSDNIKNKYKWRIFFFRQDSQRRSWNRELNEVRDEPYGYLGVILPGRGNKYKGPK